MRLLMLVKCDSTHTADIFAAVRYTASARLRYIIAAYGTFVTGNIYYLNYVGICRIAAHSDFNTFRNDSSLLVDTATELRCRSRNKCKWDVISDLIEVTCKCSLCDLKQNCMFDFDYVFVSVHIISFSLK